MQFTLLNEDTSRSQLVKAGRGDRQLEILIVTVSNLDRETTNFF